MGVELVKEKWSNAINTVTIGATKEEGGTRTSKVTVGGASTLPYLFGEGDMPNKPVVAMEILDIEPVDWPAVLKEPFKDVLNNPVEWAKRCVNEYKAKLLCLKLQGIHPDFGDASADKAAACVKSILEAVGVPLIVLGCGD
ncbi:MAG: acetyl-CoA decarbonylase/synthase complex subunit delta, partial [Candidatus Omnitrophica bacterium]|nr:acetyl-CoA decarbonylase/synthase complex subunit delta [Candidatus Omnitrophota bacterium]